MNWRKSTYSRANGDCVEVGGRNVITVRDSQLGESSPVLTVSSDTWTKFLRSVA